jgi:hypothetical protein
MNILNEQAMILSEASLLQIPYLDCPSIEMAKICKHCFCSCKQNKVRHLEMVQKMQPCQLGLSIREDKTHLWYKALHHPVLPNPASYFE